MTTNILLVILMALAIIGLVRSIDIEKIPLFKRDNDKASKWLRKKISEGGGKDVQQADETTISFTIEDVRYHLDWHLEPVTSLCTFFLLNEEVDLEKAKKVADFLTNSCESLMIRINDDREMGICCTTIVPDAKSLLPVMPFMIELIGRAYMAFGKEYEAQSNTN